MLKSAVSGLAFAGRFSLVAFVTATVLLSTAFAEEPPSSLEQLSQLQQEYGPFDGRQLQPVLEAGLALQEQGHHRDAIPLLQHAFQLSRVVDGLYNEAQLDLLDRLVDSEIALENWQRVDEHYAYMEQLYRHLYDEYDMRLEQGLQKIVAWHVNALEFDLDDRHEYHLRATNNLFKSRLRVAKNILDEDHPKFDFLYEGIALSASQLRLYSRMNRELLGDSSRRNRDAMIADID